MPAKGWGSVSLPEEIISDIDAFLEKPPKKYSSRNEFVRHAVYDLLLREGFYVRREEYHLSEDELASRRIQKKDEKPGKASSQVEVIELERIEDLEESLDKTIVDVDDSLEADGCG